MCVTGLTVELSFLWVLARVKVTGEVSFNHNFAFQILNLFRSSAALRTAVLQLCTRAKEGEREPSLHGAKERSDTSPFSISSSLVCGIVAW